MSIPLDSVGAAEALKKALENGPAPPGAYDNKGGFDSYSQHAQVDYASSSSSSSASPLSVTFEVFLSKDGSISYAYPTTLDTSHTNCAYDTSKCADGGADCCASDTWGEPQACADGYVAVPSPAGDCQSTYSNCDTFYGGVGCYACYPPSCATYQDPKQLTIGFHEGSGASSGEAALSFCDAFCETQKQSIPKLGCRKRPIHSRKMFSTVAREMPSSGTSTAISSSNKCSR